MRTILVIAVVGLTLTFVLEKVSMKNLKDECQPLLVQSSSSSGSSKAEFAQHHTELKIAADDGQLNVSLSQALLFVKKIEDFFKSKYNINFENKNWTNDLKNCFVEFKIEDLQAFLEVSAKDDQKTVRQEGPGKQDKNNSIKSPSVSDSSKTFEAETIQLMGSLLNKIFEKLQKNKKKEKQSAKYEKMPKEEQENDGMLFVHQLFKISSKIVETILAQLTDNANKDNRLEKFGEDGSLIQVENYEKLKGKFSEIAETIERNPNFKEKIKIPKSVDLNSVGINVKWIQKKETISAWLLYKPEQNEVRFAGKLCNSCIIIRIFLENGPDERFNIFVKEIKAWQIVMPKAIGKIKKEIGEKINYFIEHFELKFNQPCESNRLFLLTLDRIAKDFVQNAINIGLLNEGLGFIEPFYGKSPQFPIIKKEPNETLAQWQEKRKQNLDYLKQKKIYDFYYDKMTGEQLKKLMEFYKKEALKNEFIHGYVSMKELGKDDDEKRAKEETKREKYIRTKVLHSLEELFKRGESLALIEWLHTYHRVITMTELIYLAEKVHQLFFGDVNANEWKSLGYPNYTVSLYFDKFEKKLNAMTYEQLTEWFKNDATNLDEESKKFLDKFFDYFDFVAKNYLCIGKKKERKVLFCLELITLTSELLEKFEGGGDRQRILFYQVDKDMLKSFTEIVYKAKRMFSYFSQVQIKNYIQVDFKIEDKISSTFKMHVDIPLQNIAKMVETIGVAIKNQFGKHLWHLANKDDPKKEIQNCSKQIDFDEMFKQLKKESAGFSAPQPIFLFNLFATVLHCQHQASEKGVKTWNCPFKSDILLPIASDAKTKFAILKGLLKFGQNNVFGNPSNIGFDIFKQYTMDWNNIEARITKTDSDKFFAMQNSFTSGLLYEMFSINENVVAKKKVYISMKNICDLVNIISAFIYSNCGTHLWHLANMKASKELKECSNKLDFGNWWTNIEQKAFIDQLTLLNMIAHGSSNSEATTGAVTTTYSIKERVLSQIHLNLNAKFILLKNLLKLGCWLNKELDNIMQKYWENKKTLIWNNIEITIFWSETSSSFIDKKKKMKEALEAAGLRQKEEQKKESVFVRGARVAKNIYEDVKNGY